MPEKYPEIDALKNFHSTHNIKISINSSSKIEGVIETTIQIKGTYFFILVQDEYQDFEIDNSLLHTVLVLRECEMIKDSTDYLDWCNQQDYLANNEFLRQYYQDSVKHLSKMARYFNQGEITSFISDLDFQLNAGAAQFLRITTYI